MSTRKTVDLNDFADELGKFAHVSIAKKKKAIIKGIAKSIPKLAAASPVDTGRYASSWDFTVDENKVIIGNYAPYAGIIEYGARPHMPPIGPLLAWAKRVLKSKSQPPEYDSEVWALAKGVQMKIAAVGQAPRHILENSIPMIIKNVREELRLVA